MARCRPADRLHNGTEPIACEAGGVPRGARRFRSKEDGVRVARPLRNDQVVGWGIGFVGIIEDDRVESQGQEKDDGEEDEAYIRRLWLRLPGIQEVLLHERPNGGVPHEADDARGKDDEVVGQEA